VKYWARRPGTAALAALTLGLGIGAAGTIFAALWSVVLHPLPYRDPASLVVVHSRFTEMPLARLNASPLDYAELSARPDLFSDAGAYQFEDFNRTGVERAQKINAVSVTRGLFDVLDVQPVLGRLFQPEETPSVVISERYWESDFGRDPGILNRSLLLDGRVYPIVGVMPASFAFPNEVTQMWVPLTFRPAQLLNSKNVYLRVVARLARGVSFVEASERLQEFSQQQARTAEGDSARARPGWALFLAPMGADDDGSRRWWIAILFVAVMSLWAIVCWNFASLLLVRWTDQQFDLAVRRTLGASRGQLAWQVFREALILSAAAGVGGGILTQAGVRLFSRYGSAGTIRMDSEVYWFCLGLPFLTAVLAGAYPAWNALRESPLGVLREAGHQRTAAKGTRRWQHGLIVAQVAAATVMLAAGGLFTRSLIALLQVPVGFDAHHVTTIEITLPPERYKDPILRQNFWDRVMAEVRALPGVTAVSGCSLLPFGYGENINTFSVEGEPKARVEPFADINNVFPDYFDVMRIPLRSGRVLDGRDAGKPVIVIDEGLAARYFSGKNPIGRKIRVPWGVFEVVGVAGSVKNAALDVQGAPELYFATTPPLGTTLTIRTEQRVPELSKLVARIVSGIDRDQPIYNVIPEEEFVEHSLKTRRFVAWLAGAFAAAGTLLAALGVFNLLSYTVQMRQKEIGIRMAVGASGRVIAVWVCRSGASLVLCGLAAGALVFWCAQGLLRSQLYGVGTAEPSVWGGVLGVVGLMGAAASVLPAWRAARTNPSESLRS
jgi:putative ABC transport system permease protein